MRKLLNRPTTFVLLTVIAISQMAFACDSNRAKKFSEITNTIAQTELSVANFFKDCKESGACSQEDINAIKPLLIGVNDANREAIAFAKTLPASGEIPVDKQTELLQYTSRISSRLVALNNVGTLRIKNPEKRAVFSAFIVTLQGAVSSGIILFVKKG